MNGHFQSLIARLQARFGWEGAVRKCGTKRGGNHSTRCRVSRLEPLETRALLSVSGVADSNEPPLVAQPPSVAGSVEYGAGPAIDGQLSDLGEPIVFNASAATPRLFATAFPQGILEIDPVSGSVINVVLPPAFSPENFGVGDALAFDGRSLWFLSGSFNSNTLYELNPNTGAIIDSYTLPDGSFRMGMTALDGLIYITHGSAVEQDIVAFDPVTEKIVQTLDINGLNPGTFFGSGLGSLTNPDVLLISGATENLIYVVDAETGQLVDTLTLGENENGLGLTGFNDEIYVGRHVNRDMIVYDRAGNPVRTLTVGGASGFQSLAGGYLAPAISVQPAFGLTTTEAGGAATFSVHLETPPTAPVTVALQSSDTSEGIISSTSLTFTPINWSVPQTVTITGVDDSANDGDVMYKIVTAPAVSADPNYSGLDARDASVINQDDEISGAKGRLFATKNGQGIVEIDPATGAVVNTFATPVTQGVNDGLAFDGTSLWYLSGSFQGNALYQLDPDTGTVISNFPLPNNAFRDGLTALNGLVFLTHTAAGEHDIVAFDPSTGKIVRTLDIDGHNPGMFFAGGLGSLTDPDVLLVTGALNDLVYAIDPVTGLVVDSFTQNQGAGDLGVAGWNNEIFIGTNTSSDVYVYDRSGNQLRVMTVPLGGGVQSLGGGALREGIAASPTSHLTTTESGGTAEFTVVLESRPVADVTIPISSSNTAEGTVSPDSITFTPANWNVPRTITITGVNDDTDDGSSSSYSIVLGQATSTDPFYSGFDPADVMVANLNDDTAGITIIPQASLTTSEAGGTDSFTIVLDSEPLDDVTVSFTSSDTSEGTVTPSVTFTPLNWSFPQVVAVVGVDDKIDDGDVAYTVVTQAAVSGDFKYGGLDAVDVAVTNIDDDTAGISVNPTSGLTTTEVGGQATFSVVLDSEPTSDVTIGVSSSDTTEGTISTASLTFTPNDWDQPQTVTITGVDDDVDDDNASYTIVTAAAVSGDANYFARDAANVDVTNVDDDTAGISVSPVSGLVITEAGGAATFTVVLDSQPTDDVLIGISSNDVTEGSVSVAALTFTPANWSTPRIVTVTGVDDDVDDGDVSFTIRTGFAVSDDLKYGGINPADVAVVNINDDTAGITVVPTAGLETTEAGGTATFTVRLNSRPTGDVSIPLSSSDATEGIALSDVLVFKPSNWSQPQTVTVQGVDDFVADGDAPYTIRLDAATSTDGQYNGLDGDDASAVNRDDDTIEVVVAPTSGLMTDESGAFASFAVVLGTRPTNDVTITMASSNPLEGTLSTDILVFTPDDWDLPQTVTVTGVDDDLQDGNVAYTIITSTALSADLDYDGLAVADVAVTNVDDDTAGITVVPVSDLVTSEAGDTATFTVVLDSKPTSDVTIAISSSDTTEAAVSAALLTFTNQDWNVPQTVTITGVDDAVDDGDVAYAIVVAAAASDDATYNGIDPADVAATNVDDDTAGVTVIPVLDLVTSEAGDTATFTVVLDSEPTSDVAIAISSSDTTEAVVSAASLTFTNQNWDVPQTVTITGIDDAVDDGDVAYTIVTAAAASDDTIYNGIDPDDVAVTNTDDDTAGVTVVPVSELVTSEAGDTATFSIVLDSEPTSDVTIAISPSDTTEAAVSTASLTFTNQNWNVPQTVTITGVDDAIDDGDVAYTIVIAAAVTDDAIYNGIDPADVAVTNTDDDTAGITVVPISDLVTSEAGDTATFTVVLDSKPTSDVTIALTSSDATEAAVSTASLIFTDQNWNVPQTVTITGVDDAVDDGDVACTIVTAAAVSDDAIYNGIDPDDVAVTNVDDDTAGITVVPVSDLVTIEAGDTGAFTVVLDSEPTSDVTIAVSSSDTTEGVVSAASLTFTNENWNVPQTVTITGVDDAVDDGDVAYTIVTAAAVSDDTIYNGIDPADVAVTNIDDDTAGITVAAVSDLLTSEAGDTATFTVVLDSEPTSDVTIAVSSSNTTEGAVSAASLTFTNQNWNVPQTVTITGVDDAVDDGDVAYTIVTGAAVSDDTIYNGIDPDDVAVTNVDGDTAGVTVVPTSDLVTSEAGDTATFTIVLDSEPTSDVTIAISSSDTTEGAVSTASLIFTNQNWNVPQTVTITGVDDAVDDGEVAYTIVTAAAMSDDATYGGIDPADVAVTNVDDDTAGITVVPVSDLVTSEAGDTATFTVVLDSEPTSDVTIAISSSDTTEGAVSTASLIFTNQNWNVPQTVTITGVDDAVDDGEVAYTIVTAAAVSDDDAYNDIDPADVAVNNTDDDTAGVTIVPVLGLVTSEAGDTASFTVVLDCEPTSDVTIVVSSSDTTEGNLSAASLTFTNQNWNVPQSVTITGVNDAVDDGDVAYTIVTAAAVSDDNAYHGIDPADVAVTNVDDDTAGITVAAISDLVTSEAGDTATFTVVLDSEPTAPVTIAVASSNPAEGTVAPAQLMFTPQNWNVPQSVTITGVDDAVDDGDVAYTIVIAAAVSDDAAYNGIDPADVAVTNTDDETFVPTDLGQVDFRRLDGLTPGAEGLWFQLEMVHDAWLTVQATAEWTADQLSVSLYSPSDRDTPLATTSGAVPRFDHAVQQGQVCLIWVTGSASNASLLLANLVHESGSAVTVYGTSLDDELIFDAAASREVTINGVAYHYEDTQVATVDFDGGDGHDLVWLYDSPGDETLEAWPDRALLTNSSGDSVPDFVVDARGFEDLQGYARQGGTDSAEFHGSENADKLKSYEDSVRLRAKNMTYMLRAKLFDTVVGDTGSGGNDAAVFNGTDGDETFTYNGADGSSRVEGKRRDHLALGFQAVIVRAEGGDNDVAHFTGIPGVDDVFYFKGHKTQLVSETVKVTARTFDVVHATAADSSFDVARIYDTSGDEHLEVVGDTARLYRHVGAELDLLYEAIGFDRVKAYSTEGNDTTDIGEHTLDLIMEGWDQ